MDRSAKLEERMLDFGVNTINAVKDLNIPRSVIDQVIRSATSVGANYTEANNASSRLDFRNKVFIAKKEASETRYWLKVIQRLEKSDNIQPLINEVTELILILQKIVTTLKARSEK